MGDKIAYYIDILPFSIHKGGQYTYDDTGVILSKIPYTDEYHYHATAIASAALIDVHVEENIQWLIDNMDSEGVIHHRFTLPFYDMKEGWIGGLAQGLTASALIRNGCREEGMRAIAGLLKYCYDDGVIYEYPSVEILNGWIYGIFGLMDTASIDSYYQRYVNNAMDALHSHLPFYDIGGWTAYDYTGIPAPPFYHNVHLKQFNVLNIPWDDTGKYPWFKRMLMILLKHTWRLPIVAYKRWIWKQ